MFLPKFVKNCSLIILSRKLFPLIIFLIAYPPFYLFSQQKSINIQSIPAGTKIILDGQINEPFWQNIPPFDDFLMQEPIEGSLPTERTAIRLAYDTENLYIAVVLYDANPSEIKAFQKKRDAAVDTDDSFSWIFDTYLDKRNAYKFTITPKGLKSDALISTGQGSTINKDWDGIWHLRTQIGDFGWSAEIKIPFRTLNFPKDQATWGVNFKREIRRKNETVLWSGHKLNQGIDRPQNAGLLVGLDNISQGIGLEAKPFAIIRNEKVGDNASKTKASAGFDVNYNITTNLKASLTINTDFAETEVDDRQINLTRFPLRFPEKRDFFLEGAGIYSYAPRSGVNPYFSRSIGLRNGQPIPIKYGARILGRVGGIDMALLQVRTGETAEVNAENFTVARLKKNLGKESTLGFVYTRRGTEEGEQPIEFLQNRHTYGADLAWNTSTFLSNKNLQFQAFFTFHNPAFTDDKSSNILDRSSRGFRFNFPNQPWFAHCSYREFGTGFDPGVGFNRRNAFRRIEPSIGFAPIFQKSTILRQVTTRVSFENLWDLGFKLLTQNLRMTLADIRFESGARASLLLTRNYERLESDFDILRDESIIIPLEEYTNWILRVRLNTAVYRKLVGTFDVERGGFWSGTRTTWRLGTILRPFSGLNLSVNYAYSKVRLMEGNFSTSLLQFQGGYDITPYLSLSSILQFDNISKVLGMNHRFRWIITPGSDVFIVYNQNWISENLDYRLLDRSAVLKVNYTHRF